MLRFVPPVRFIPGAVLALVALAGCAVGSEPGSDAGPSIDARSPDGAPPEQDGGPGGCSVDCSAIVTPACMTSVCNDGSLPGAAGTCVMVPMADDTACDDGDFCTVGDTCAAGACTGAPNDCGMTAGDCEQILCDSTAEACTVSPAGDGAACTPAGDLCVTGAVCSSGVCTGGTPMDCSSTPVPNACQVAACNPSTGVCELMSANEGGACVDASDPCTSNDTCTAGTCGGGTPTDCSAMDSECTIGVCNTSDGSCMAMPFNEGGGCDDGDACTTASVCTSGVCGGGTSPACSLTVDGCCPSTCTTSNDADCGCPGEMIGGVCVYLPSTVSVTSQSSARSACTGLGAGWDLCGPSVTCEAATSTYLASSGCGCGGGAATCACGSADNIYVHVDGTDSPFYLRGPDFPTCLTSAACTDSVSETCGVPLCCR